MLLKVKLSVLLVRVFSIKAADKQRGAEMLFRCCLHPRRRPRPQLPEKRRPLGSGVGGSAKEKAVSADTPEFLVDVMRRRDRGNDGMNRSECLDMLQDLHTRHISG